MQICDIELRDEVGLTNVAGLLDILPESRPLAHAGESEGGYFVAVTRGVGDALGIFGQMDLHTCARENVGEMNIMCEVSQARFQDEHLELALTWACWFTTCKLIMRCISMISDCRRLKGHRPCTAAEICLCFSLLLRFLTNRTAYHGIRTP